MAYSSADATNFVWFTRAQDGGIYKKYGLEVELIFIQSSTMSVSTLIAGDIQVAQQFRRHGRQRGGQRRQSGDDGAISTRYLMS